MYFFFSFSVRVVAILFMFACCCDLVCVCVCVRVRVRVRVLLGSIAIKTNVLSIEWYINTNPPYRSFYCIYLSVALSCRTGSFPLSLRVILRSTISFYPSLYHVVPDLFVVSLNLSCRSDLVCVCVLLRSTVSTDPSRHSDLVRVLLSPPPSTVSIDPSLNRFVPDLFVSFYVPFRSCLCLCSCSSPFDRSYTSVSLSSRTGSIRLSLRVLLLLHPTVVISTPSGLPVWLLLLLIVELIFNGFERTSLANRSFDHCIRHLFINWSCILSIALPHTVLLPIFVLERVRS